MIYGVYHKDCEDGVVSAIILKKAIPDIFLYSTSHAGEWKEILPLKKDDEVIFVDISGKPEDLAELNEKGVAWKVIDHHKTSYEEITAYKKDHPDFNTDNFHYYPEKSGATATWDFFFKNKKQPELLKFIEITDLWTWNEDNKSKYIAQYIRTVCKRASFEDYEQLLKTFDYDEAAEKGELLYKKFMHDVAYIASNAAELDFKGERVLAVNSDHAISEVGHALAERSTNDIGVVFHFKPGYKYVKCSVRGNPGTDAARKFAEKHGGGGHDEAAAFEMKTEDFFKILKKTNS